VVSEAEIRTSQAGTYVLKASSHIGLPNWGIDSVTFRNKTFNMNN
jgi:hypothetical protein